MVDFFKFVNTFCFSLWNYPYNVRNGYSSATFDDSLSMKYPEYANGLVYIGNFVCRRKRVY